jgi:hypothetical protein
MTVDSDTKLLIDTQRMVLAHRLSKIHKQQRCSKEIVDNIKQLSKVFGIRVLCIDLGMSAIQIRKFCGFDSVECLSVEQRVRLDGLVRRHEHFKKNSMCVTYGFKVNVVDFAEEVETLMTHKTLAQCFGVARSCVSNWCVEVRKASKRDT